jgi:DNA-directed RNA polymerase subunit RPC12/RpoP
MGSGGPKPRRPCYDAAPMLYQVVCLSCGYHRDWATLLEAHADGHRHQAEQEVPPEMRTELFPMGPPPLTETHVRRCPHCLSDEVAPTGRVTVILTQVRVEYRCHDCSNEFVLLR